MAYLYCIEHGKAALQSLAKSSAENSEGDGTIVTKGTLKLDNLLCDSCNKALKEGDTAYFVNFLTAEMVDEFYSYDWADEYSYFSDFNSDEVELFGLEWPA